MYAGAKDDSGKLSWMDYPNYGDAVADGAIDLRQNIRLLIETALRFTLVTEYLHKYLQLKSDLVNSSPTNFL